MEANYLILLNYYNGDIMVIRFTKQEKEEMSHYDDFQTYMWEVLEERYNFDSSENHWSVVEEYHFIRQNF